MKSKKEKRGIYNTTFNDKKATLINLKSDIELVEDAIINEVVMYVKGWHNIRRDKGIGARHIKAHLEKDSEGYITIDELLNLGNSMREYLKIFKEPYLEDKDKTGRVFEWQNKEMVRFRVAIDDREEGLIPPLSLSNKVIISFYSDRNLNEKMIFKNPKVEEYYSNLDIESVEKDLENIKDLSSDFNKIFEDDKEQTTKNNSNIRKNKQ